VRAAIIVNPISGVATRRADAAAVRTGMARDAAARLGIDATIVCTTHHGHAAALAASFVAAGFERVVAWGGDGTVNEVAGPLVRTDVTFGVVATGSGNGFARSLKLPRDPGVALRLALTGPRSQVDVGVLAGRHFLNVAGVGFDAALARAFNADVRRGIARYLQHGWSLGWRYRSMSYRIELDGRELHGKRLLVAFANGCEYGAGCVIAPGADLRDGLLDVVIVDSGGPLALLWRARRLVFSPARAARGIWRTRASRVTIAGDQLVGHVDGEPFEAEGEVHAEVLRGAMWVAS
jgi:diacylglycerol kinase (ATP)